MSRPSTAIMTTHWESPGTNWVVSKEITARWCMQDPMGPTTSNTPWKSSRCAQRSSFVIKIPHTKREGLKEKTALGLRQQPKRMGGWGDWGDLHFKWAQKLSNGFLVKKLKNRICSLLGLWSRVGICFCWYCHHETDDQVEYRLFIDPVWRTKKVANDGPCNVIGNQC